MPVMTIHHVVSELLVFKKISCGVKLVATESVVGSLDSLCVGWV